MVVAELTESEPVPEATQEPVRARLLLVEDEPVVAQLFQDQVAAVAPGAVEVVWKRTYQEGLAALAAERFDLCLVDYLLGGELTGLHLIENARLVGVRTPIVLVTGVPGSLVGRAALRLGAYQYVQKASVDLMWWERQLARVHVEMERPRALPEARPLPRWQIWRHWYDLFDVAVALMLLVWGAILLADDGSRLRDPTYGVLRYLSEDVQGALMAGLGLVVLVPAALRAGSALRCCWRVAMFGAGLVVLTIGIGIGLPAWLTGHAALMAGCVPVGALALWRALSWTGR